MRGMVTPTGTRSSRDRRKLWQKRGVRRALVVTFGLVLFGVAPFVAVPSYDFPGLTPFLGTRWHNPYAGWSGSYQKVNLHSHSRAWGGLTAGDATPHEMAQAYADWGFQALALSNYHQLTEVPDAPLPMVRAYEHGFNVTKSHRLVLGADRAIGFDFPVSTRSGRQWLLDVLGSSGLVGLNHPSLRQGHPCEDVQALTGYSLFEVHNAYATSFFEWDCALSAGRLAWAMGNDDSHAAQEEKIGVAWNMIGSSTTDERSLLAAIGAGRSYVVRGERGRMDVELLAFEVGQQMRVVLSGPAEAIEWVTDGGMVRQIDRNASTSTFVPHRTDHYVRVVVRTPRTEVVLNPATRAGGWVAPRATINWGLTLAGWVGWFVAAAAAAWLWRSRPRHLTIVADSARRVA